MLRKIAIALAAASLVGVASIPLDALAAGHGGGGHGGGGFGHGGSGRGGFARGFAGGHGVAHSFAGHGFVGRGFGPGFRGYRHRFARFGVPFYGYYYDDACYVWTPFGYTWICGYDY